MAWDAADFAVDGTATASVTGISGTGASRDVTVSAGNLASFVAVAGLTLDATGHGITDVAGNALTSARPAGSNNERYAVDNIAPVVEHIRRQTPTAERTNADILQLRVEFSERPNGVQSSEE